MAGFKKRTVCVCLLSVLGLGLLGCEGTAELQEPFKHNDCAMAFGLLPVCTANNADDGRAKVAVTVVEELALINSSRDS